MPGRGDRPSICSESKVRVPKRRGSRRFSASRTWSRSCPVVRYWFPAKVSELTRSRGPSAMSKVSIASFPSEESSSSGRTRASNQPRDW